jgi:hypothetical protein
MNFNKSEQELMDDLYAALEGFVRPLPRLKPSLEEQAGVEVARYYADERNYEPSNGAPPNAHNAPQIMKDRGAFARAFLQRRIDRG